MVFLLDAMGPISKVDGTNCLNPLFVRDGLLTDIKNAVENNKANLCLNPLFVRDGLLTLDAIEIISCTSAGVLIPYSSGMVFLP